MVNSLRSSVICFLVLAWFLILVEACHKAERKALMSFGKDLVFSDGTSFDWGNDEDCCKWPGVSCNQDRHMVQLLGITDRPLVLIPGTNSLNSSLQQLRYLEVLSFGGINFRGVQLPNWIFSFMNLRYLDLLGCNFGGSLPVQLGNLIHLEMLDLSSNKFKGPIPEAFWNMTSLRSLNIEDNLLQSGIPMSLGNLCFLKEIDISSNYLSGDISDLFRNLSSGCTHTSLESLVLSTNRFTGSIPDTIMSFSNLTELSLAFNNLNGTISPHIGQLSRLWKLDLQRNSLSGVLNETHFSGLSDLGYLDLSYNALTLNFSSTWSPVFKAIILSLSTCKLGSRFPAWLQSQLPTRLVFLDISLAGISDMMPKWFSDSLPSSTLCYLNMSYNEIRGRLQTNMSLRLRTSHYPPRYTMDHCPSDYTVYDFSSNLMQGLIPTFPDQTRFINLSNNSFSGPLSPFCETHSPYLEFVDVSQNLLSGEVPNHCIGQYKNMKVLNLANNNLSGPIPSSIWSLESLRMLNLRENNFWGELPHDSSNCTELQFLDLSHNQFSGNIPEWIGQRLSSLTLLSLRANQFIGDIPSQVCKMKHLQVLDLGLNKLSGTLPRCLDDITTMACKQNLTAVLKQSYQLEVIVPVNVITDTALFKLEVSFIVAGDYIYNAFLMWLGEVREYSKILGYVVLIDVSDNELSGEIPAQVANLTELVVLNLSRNNFSGIIPPNIGQLKSLQVLDLSRNQLSGHIPSGMSALTFLSWMDLSYNNLSGQIPTSTQILGFDPSRFAGNRDLCGLPFKLHCSGDDDDGGGDGGHNPGVGDNDDDEFYKWFYIAIGVGYGTSFSLLCGTLLLKRSWRDAYFHLLDVLGNGIDVAFVLQKRKLMARLQT